MIERDLFPRAARYVYMRTDSAVDLTNFNQLHPEEKGLVSRAVDRRKAEFGDARWCAHEALAELGYGSSEAILRGEGGMPLWPDGVSGSLTHTEGFRAAVVAPVDHLVSVGIDCEPAGPLPEGVVDQIARSQERQQIDTMRSNGIEWADRLIFCAKEATYKCWFPLSRRWLGFDGAEIEVHPDGTFTSYILARPAPVPFFEGRWKERAGFIVTSAFVTAEHAARFIH
ncbi:4'-phosphopantetheinyl transferase Npt [Corynebacterium capitovis DSM 44611]|uniref:4'-phosphopantetheinyl transferase family protein n=1 Tax=Corynebacterium capitovis TaxID=131081 RepID=UPI00036FB8F9|nr:4'-phosphopantetheinyl transferase superfamily protein [Corynebacterium capitovis]WKD57480.1 4'-phosphopantetheinyl transferase Npt [Corynebacterium capitovis DSM 44611]